MTLYLTGVDNFGTHCTECFDTKLTTSNSYSGQRNESIFQQLTTLIVAKEFVDLSIPCKSLFSITSRKSLFPGLDFSCFKWEKNLVLITTLICLGKFSLGWQVGEMSVSYI